MPERITKRSYCRFCLSFCGVEINYDSNGIPIKVSGDSNHPLSKGYTCSKGRNLLSFYSKNRKIYPTNDKKKGGWNQILTSLGEDVRKVVDRYGKDSVALYAGTNAILDATGMWAALGFMYRLGSESTYTVSSIDAINKQILIEQMTSFSTSGLIPQVDFDNTDLLLIVGSNPVVSHGHLAGVPYPGKRLRDIKKRGGRVIVADPHKTQTSKLASCHIQPKPGSDYAWLGFVIRELLLGNQSENLIDWEYIQQHSSGLEQIKEVVDYFDEKITVGITGLDVKILHNIVSIIKKSKKISGVSGTGLSFCNSGIVSEWFLWVLLAIKGSLDKPGGVWFNPGLTTNLSKINPLFRTTKTAWSGRGVARPDLPTRSGEHPVSGLADEIIAKNVRILICVGGNPLSAFPDTRKTLSALNELEALVVLDTHNSDLTDMAEYALPVCGQLERSDSSIYSQNSVSRVSCQYTNKVIDSPGEAKPVWWIFSKLGENLGLDIIKLNKKTEEINDYDVLKTIKGGGELFDNKDFLKDGYIEKKGIPFGWVIDSILPGKKWLLYSDTLATELGRVLGEERANKNNLLLISTREKDHLNSQFIQESDEYKIPKAIISPSDGVKYGVKNGDLVEFYSEVNSMQACIFISQEMLVGAVSIPHGFKRSGNVSRLTSSECVNPLSGMVTQSAIHVKIKKRK